MPPAVSINSAYATRGFPGAGKEQGTATAVARDARGDGTDEGSAGRGQQRNVMLRPLVVFNLHPTPTFVHPQQRETPRRSVRHLSHPTERGSLLLARPPRLPSSWRDTTGFKGCAGRETAARARFPFPTLRHGQPTDGSLPVRITPLSP